MSRKKEQFIRAAEALASGNTVTAVAEIAGVHRKTISRWQKHREFAQEVTSIRKSVFQQGSDKLSSAVSAAVDTLHRLLIQKELKKSKPVDKDAVAEMEAKIKGLSKESRELKVKAESIENAVYDLKAMNPHKQEEDTRTPAELLEQIEQKGQETTKTLKSLR